MKIYCLTAYFLLMGLFGGASCFAYDPLVVKDGAKPAPMDFVVVDTQRKRQIPIRVYLPITASPSPVVLFSHGLGGSKENNPYLGRHWSYRSYVVVFLQHPGSDSAVWQNAPKWRRGFALKRAASAKNFMLRNKDVSVVLDHLEKWNKSPGHKLAGRLDMKRVGMSGHSFGAVTTQAVSGQSFSFGGSPRDFRIKAALLMSPSTPARGNAKKAFGSVSIPWMLMTGTLDDSPIGNTTPKTRLEVFANLPSGAKYQVVLNGAEHSAFSDRALPGDKAARNPNHHKVILGLSTAFWDAWLKMDSGAKTWLDGPGPRSLMQTGDVWQKK